MSRNKFILLLIILASIYIFMPDYGIYHTVKINAVALLPYIMAFIIIYLIITINVLKRRWRKLDADVNDETVIGFAKMMNITFDVKRMLGPSNLIELYTKVNFSVNASLEAKKLLYEAMRRKRLDVPPPGKGTNADEIVRRAGKTPEEVRAAAVAAAARAKKQKRKKKRKK